MMIHRHMVARRKNLANKPVAEPKKVEPAKVETVQEEPEKEEATAEVSWTAEEINKMPFMKLKSVAKKNDVEVKDRDAKDIRSELIEKLGL